MAIDMALVNRGRRETRASLLPQTRKLIELALHYARPLAAWGWTTEDTRQLQEAHDILATEIADQALAKDVSKQATLRQNEALSKAKLLKRRLDRAVRSVFRMNKDLDVGQDAFNVGERIDNSIPRMSAYLGRVQPHVLRLKDKLSPKMGGIDPVEAIREAKNALDRADATQERAREDLPEETLHVYEAMGRIMLLIAELIDAGHNAFEEEAEIAAKFNKDILVRGRKKVTAASSELETQAG